MYIDAEGKYNVLKSFKRIFSCVCNLIREIFRES